MAKTDRNASLATGVYKQLRDRMMALEIRSGTRLLEDEISEELGVGRTPVREALLRLQGEGLLERSGGWIVREIEPSMIISIFECRMAIEGYATRLAAERAMPEQIESLAEMVAAMDAGDLTRVEMNRVNRQFHETIVLISGNEIFHEIYERTQFPYWNLRTPLVIFSDDDRTRYTVKHHELLDSIAAHNPDEAERLARGHVEDTFRIVRQAFL
ncbi:GntR family transcriptional regulator [Synergistaceae bacterium OttesenSCG-928-I11]|nr:GntR family transcriptional regulator [Synergistaceae bacterium OttesenSCG-928-I11]